VSVARGPGVAANAAWLVAGGLGARLLSFVAFWLLARVLTPAQMGVITLALSVGAMCYEPGDGGLDPMVVRALSRAHGRESARLGAAFAAKALYVTVGAAVAFASLALLVPDAPSRHAAMLLVGGWVVGSLGRTLSAVFQARERFVWKGALDLGRSGTLAAGGLVLWVAGAGVGAAGFLYGIAEVVQAMLTAFIQRLHFGHVRATLSTRLTVRLARQAWLPGLSALAAMVYLVGDRVLLWRFTSRAEVGVYEAVSRIPLAFAVLPAAISMAAFPAISGRDRARARRIYREALVLMVTLAVPLGVGGAVLANPGVALLYPPAYAAMGQPFAAIWMVVGAVIFVSYVPSSALLALGRTTELARITASLAAGNIVLNLLVDPWLGTRGAASVMLLTQLAGLVAYSLAAGRELGVAGPWSVLDPRVVLASGLAGLVAGLLPGGVVLRAAAGFVAYAGALAILRGWPSEAIRVLREGLADSPRATGSVGSAPAVDRGAV